MLTTTFHFGFLARQVLFPVLLAGAASAATAQSPDRSQISQLFVQVKVNASVLSIDAGTLESYTRSQADWKSPARQLEMIRDHLDGFLGDLNRLKNVRSQGATWQQETIDSIEPAMRSAAYELIGTMELMGRNEAHLQTQEYREYARAKQILLDKAVAVICSHIEYGEAQARSIRSERNLRRVTSGSVRKSD